MDVVSTLIRSEISLYDEARELFKLQAAEETNETQEGESEADDEPPAEPCVLHGSIRPPCTIAELSQEHTDDPAFGGLRKKLASALAQKLGIQRPNIQNVDMVSIELLLLHCHRTIEI